jgi:hypothetical protein
MAVLKETRRRVEALTHRNRGNGSQGSSRHLTKTEEIREVYAMQTRQLYGTLEAEELGWYDFEVGSASRDFALRTEHIKGWIRW